MDKTISEITKRVYSELHIAGILEAKEEAEIIITEVCQLKNKLDIYLKGRNKINLNKLALLEKIINKRKIRYPLAYIIKKASFFGLEFYVNPHTMIPRQETELLAEECLGLLFPGANVLEIGSGCGNVSVCLAKHFENVNITSIDISRNAIRVAKLNSKIYGVNKKIKFLEMDLFSRFLFDKLPFNSFDLIISNPPYISQEEFFALQPEIYFEPVESLYGGTDGLKFYKGLAMLSRTLLKKDSYLITEIGFNMSENIKDIFAKENLKIEKIRKDYSQNDRVIVAQKQGQGLRVKG
ncbi:MAG: peptide chain release factor N(5)-glutamine methyltransferase [Elusimicrobiota bacterium]